ncbi:MAG: DUF1156 domain-containing protein [Planctomycetes bacterium]|nr:DUF1156 domain-containing protein [Planctomycetota bacterium]
MLKRLIEVALPLKEVSEQSSREKSIRHGHISTLHIWWARRPLAACRAVVFASLIPDPDDPECPESFRSLVSELLNENEFKPKNGEGSATEDTPRNRCLEYIKHLVKWENSNKSHYIEPARKLIAAAHRILHPNVEGDIPKVLDPFSGGGAIPLEALRLGCEAQAIDLNPVAHLIQLCTLVYPQKYGKANSRPLPAYIKRLIAHNKAQRRAKGQEAANLFGEGDSVEASDDLVPEVEITEAEYLKNPLAADVRYWGQWVLEKARSEIGKFYPPDSDGNVPVAYLWARTVKCPNPSCNATIPLVRQLWLANMPRSKAAIRMVLNQDSRTFHFQVESGKEKVFDFDPEAGTMRRGQAECPFCGTVANSKYLQEKGHAKEINQTLMAVVTAKHGRTGKVYRAANEQDTAMFAQATANLRQYKANNGDDCVPQEPLKPWSGVFNAPLFGLTTWGSLYNDRQALVACVLAKIINEAPLPKDQEYTTPLRTYLAFCLSRILDRNCTLCTWQSTGEKIGHVFGRQALPMVWDYVECNPFGMASGNWVDAVDWVVRVIEQLAFGEPGTVRQASAGRLPIEEATISTIMTDPPYYDAVPYSELSDFFYVWLKRVLAPTYQSLFSTLLTPKADEMVSHLGTSYPGKRKTAQDYEQSMLKAFSEMARVLAEGGVVGVMFAHKTTSAWETLIGGLLKSGLFVTSSWPLHTERTSRLRAMDSAALASSILIVCRKVSSQTHDGLWDDVRKELNEVAKERLGFFWSQGIRGADFFISAIGPALSVFGKYQRVTKLSGEEVTVGKFLDEVRGLVTSFALNKIMKTTHTANIDPDTQFYVIWKWSYGEAKVPADESFKLAQALGMDTETMWDRTGILEKAGENVLAVPVAKRMKIKDLGEPNADTTPASLIDVLHRLCVFREKNDTEGMTAFLGRSGQGRNSNLWLVAQAVSEILPDGDKEKQLMQGLLNQRDQLESAGRQGKLF